MVFLSLGIFSGLQVSTPIKSLQNMSINNATFLHDVPLSKQPNILNQCWNPAYKGLIFVFFSEHFLLD